MKDAVVHKRQSQHKNSRSPNEEIQDYMEWRVNRSSLPYDDGSIGQSSHHGVAVTQSIRYRMTTLSGMGY